MSIIDSEMNSKKVDTSKRKGEMSISHNQSQYQFSPMTCKQIYLQVIFHGCTLPRGGEKIYPNYIANVAVLASENVYFNEESAIRLPFNLTLQHFA